MKGPYKLFINIILILSEDLLKRDTSVTIHLRNLQSVAIEIFKVKQNLSNSMLCNMFQTRLISYNLRSQEDFLKVMSALINMTYFYEMFCIKGVADDSIRNKKFSIILEHYTLQGTYLR